MALRLLALSGLLAATPLEASGQIFLTELADPENNDDARYVEIFSPTGYNLTSLRIVRWTNDNSDYTSSNDIDLSSQGSLGAGEFLIVCKSKSAFDTVFAPTTCDVEGGRYGAADSNGDDQIALMDADENIIDIFGVPGEDGSNTAHEFENGRAERKAGVTTGSSTWDESEWTVDNDSADPGGEGPVDAPGGFDPRAWIGETASPPASPSPPQLPPAPPAQPICDDMSNVVSIGSVQGSGSSTPLDGSVVTVFGVVTGNGGNGFYLQDEGDGSADTSDGIFVYCSSQCSTPTVGDILKLTGTAGEYYEMTQITFTDSTDCGSRALPAAVPISPPRVEDSESVLEPLEGMLVSVASAYVAGIYNLARYGQVTLAADPRSFVPSQLWAPGSAEHSQAMLNATSTLLLDDGENVQNPETVPFITNASSAVRVGDQITNINGVLSFAYGEYHVLPSQGGGGTLTVLNGRPAEPPSVGGTIKLATFNVLNFFDGAAPGWPFGDSDNRGADKTLKSTRGKRPRLWPRSLRSTRQWLGSSRSRTTVSEPIVRWASLSRRSTARPRLASTQSSTAAQPTWAQTSSRAS